jgi:hypothetical protein
MTFGPIRKGTFSVRWTVERVETSAAPEVAGKVSFEVALPIHLRSQHITRPSKRVGRTAWSWDWRKKWQTLTDRRAVESS